MRRCAPLLLSQVRYSPTSTSIGLMNGITKTMRHQMQRPRTVHTNDGLHNARREAQRRQLRCTVTPMIGLCWYEEPSNRPRRSRRNVKPPRDVQRDEESGKDGLPGSLQRLCFAGPETMRRGSQNCKEAREGYQRKTSAKRARENENKSFLVRSAW